MVWRINSLLNNNHYGLTINSLLTNNHYGLTNQLSAYQQSLWSDQSTLSLPTIITIWPINSLLTNNHYGLTNQLSAYQQSLWSDHQHSAYQQSLKNYYPPPASTTTSCCWDNRGPARLPEELLTYRCAPSTRNPGHPWHGSLRLFLFSSHSLDNALGIYLTTIIIIVTVRSETSSKPSLILYFVVVVGVILLIIVVFVNIFYFWCGCCFTWVVQVAQNVLVHPCVLISRSRNDYLFCAFSLLVIFSLSLHFKL